MTIYTKRGDRGFTTLGTGTIVRKNHQRVEAYGTVDELSSFVGLALSCLPGHQLSGDLLWVQKQLFVIGSILAHPGQSTGLRGVTAEDLTSLEEVIDQLSAQLPPLQSFILPGGSKAAALLHVARSVCRRAERSVSSLHHESHPLEQNIVPFLNRLSDFLFCAARFVNHQEGRGEDLAGPS